MPGPGMEWIGEERRDAVWRSSSGYLCRYGRKTIRSSWRRCIEAEQEFARHCGARYAVAVNSGTSALWRLSPH
jgi:dTDP-4-amino-4,6-dideoxygalactose transaminase